MNWACEPMAAQTSPEFDKAARKLDRQVLRRIKVYLDEVCELDDPRARGKGLRRNSRGTGDTGSATIG